MPHGGPEGMEEEGACGGCGHILLDEEILASWSVEDKGWDDHDGIVGLDTVACPGCRARFYPRLEICCRALDAQALARAFPEHALPGAVRSRATCLVLGSGGSSGAGTAGGVDVPAASATATTRQPVAQLRSDIAALLHKARGQQPKEKGSSNAPGSPGGLQSLTLHIESFLAGSGPVVCGCAHAQTNHIDLLTCDASYPRIVHRLVRAVWAWPTRVRCPPPHRLPQAAVSRDGWRASSRPLGAVSRAAGVEAG